MRFSVIIPVYNTKRYLPAAVDSVLAQTFRDYEIILADDGSTDGSAALCDQLAAAHPQIIRTLHLPNGGAGRARNAALEAARGEYAAFLDSDDSLEPEMLARLDEQIGRTGAEICLFCLRHIDGQGRSWRDAGGDGTVTSLSARPSILVEWGAGACAGVWKRELFARTDVRFGQGRVGEDLVMTRRVLAKAASVVYLPDVLYNYYRREGSATNGDPRGSADIMDAMEEILTWYEREGLFDRYREELCALCVLHVLYYASWRILRQTAEDPVLPALADYTRRRFPDFARNRYIRKFAPSRRAAIALIAAGRYRLMHRLCRTRAGS